MKKNFLIGLLASCLWTLNGEAQNKANLSEPEYEGYLFA